MRGEYCKQNGPIIRYRLVMVHIVCFHGKGIYSLQARGQADARKTLHQHHTEIDTIYPDFLLHPRSLISALFIRYLNSKVTRSLQIFCGGLQHNKAF